jgi:outer membrane protein TolC
VRRRFALVAAAFAVSGAAVAPAQTLPTRTLEECVAIALERQPRLGAAGADVSRPAAGPSGDRRLPAAGLGARPPEQDERRETGLPGTGASQRYGSTRRFSLSQVLFDFGRNLDAIQSAQALAIRSRRRRYPARDDPAR